jgi:hypothetical protein
MTSTDIAKADEDDFTLVDAEAAYSGVSALVELLGACPPGYQVTGIFIHSLLVDVRMHLENVVGALSPQAGAQICPAGGAS